jgi:hypothetical protein
MKASDLKRALRLAIEVRQPTLVLGAPGIGKSNIIRDLADELFGTQVKGTKAAYAERNEYFRDVRALLLDPTDLRGLPMVQKTAGGEEVLRWVAPGFLPTKGKGILFLDELPSAPTLVQGACYQLMLPPFELGEYRLPEGWSIIAAGNRETDKAIYHRMSSALNNRLFHLTLDVDTEDWVAWAVGAGLMPEIIAFIRYRPDLLFAFDSAKNDRAFPTPRSWEFVARLLAKSPSADIEFEILKGVVGEGAASEVIGFLRVYRSLPDPDAILRNPKSEPVPTRPEVIYALCGALASKANEKTIEPICIYADRLPEEFSVMLVRDCLTYNPAIGKKRAGPFVKWVQNHKGVLLD